MGNLGRLESRYYVRKLTVSSLIFFFSIRVSLAEKKFIKNKFVPDSILDDGRVSEGIAALMSRIQRSKKMVELFFDRFRQSVKNP